MARYGLAIYGQDAYGDLSALKFDVQPFTAISSRTQDGVMDVRWTVPSGTWSNFRLVRNSSGTPINEQDGTVLIESTSPPSNFVDADLAPGRFYYYAIFLFTANAWVRVGRATGLALGEYDYGAMMYRFLPDFWREADSSANAVTQITRSPGGGVTTALVAGSANRNQPLKRFLEMVGYEFDLLRTEYDTLRNLRSTDRISGGLLGVLNQMLSVGDESALGVAQQRVIARNAVNLRKRKGTYPGLEAAISAYTSWGADVTDGKNLALTRGYEHATATNATLATDRNGAEPVLDVTFTAGAARINLTPPGYLIPVDDSNANYTVSIRSTSAGTNRAFDIEGEWFDQFGASLGTFSPTAVSDSGSGVTLASAPATPSGATWMGVEVVYDPNGVNGEVHHLDQFQVEVGNTFTGWEAPRSIQIDLSPTRVNLVTNPTFEVDTTGWSPSRATLARTTDDSKFGVASIRVTPSDYYPQAYTILPVEAGETYTATAYVLAEHAADSDYDIYITTRNATATWLSQFYGPTTIASSGDGWVRLQCTFTADADAVDVVLRVREASAAVRAASDTFLVDAVMLEKTPIVRGYFDGGSAPAAIWQGAAHNSPSSYYPGRGPKTARLGTLLPELLPPERDYTLNFS